MDLPKWVIRPVSGRSGQPLWGAVLPPAVPSAAAHRATPPPLATSSLDALAKSEGLSRQEIIRRAVIERYERSRHVQRVSDSTERMMQRWGDVLDRLGSA